MEGGEKVRRKIIGQLWNRLERYRILVILSVLMAALTVAGSLYMPILMGNAIDCILGKGRVNFTGLVPILKTGLLVALLTGLAQWIMNVCNNRVTYHMTRDIRNDAMDRITRLPLSYVDSHSHGDVVSRVITDVDTFADGLLMGFTQFFTGLATILATLFFIFSIHPGIALLVVCLTPVSLLVARFIATHTYDMFRKQSETRGEQTAFAQEMIEGEKVVKAFGYEERAKERFSEINERLSRYSLQAIFYSSLTNPCTRFVNSLVYAGVALTGALAAIKGGLTVGQLTCLLAYANQYTKPFNEISGVITELQNAIACAGRVLELISEKTEIPDSPDAVHLDQAEGKVNLSDVSFSYIPDQSLIEHLNLTASSGQRVAIVGPTGCGKTTLINLLMRFYDVNSGAIKLDEHDIRTISRKSLRGSYGMVLQDTWIRGGTVRDNILMGRDFPDETIIEAAKKAHSWDFIRKMPGKLDAVISEEDSNMSQGQKQLLCITRIMLDLPSLLILDEATSSIDTRTELKIQNAFAQMMEGRTSFVVAHRLSTIQTADVILVMRDGKIIEQGNHRTLLAQKGFYAHLYNSQYAG